MKSTAATGTLFIALLFGAAAVSSALPRHWTSFYRPREFARQQQQESQCHVEGTSIACRSARLVHSNGSYTHVHICPVDSTNPLELCFNTKLPRCCPGDLAGDQLKCVTKTTLKFGSEVIEVQIHTNTISGRHCIAFDEAHQDSISSCCPFEGNGMEDCEPRPEPPQCVPKRDVYFVVDSTNSTGDNMFCRFGYVLQLITAAINPRGLDAARVAAVLFHFSRAYPTRYLFTLDDSCNTIVNTNIRQVVYEYYGVQSLGLDRSSLTYPNVRALTTLPNSALRKVLTSIRDISKPSNRPASVITLTDGKSHQEVTRVVDDLKQVSDPLIAAGIGADVDVPYLVNLASNSSTVVYEPNRDNAISLGIKIVEIMRDTAALCPEEAASILASLNAATESNLQEYCSRCMWKTNSQMTPAEQQECSTRTPTCGARNLIMQAFDEAPSRENNAVMSDWEKLLLRGEIQKAVESVIAKIEG